MEEWSPGSRRRKKKGGKVGGKSGEGKDDEGKCGEGKSRRWKRCVSGQNDHDLY